MNDLRDNDSGIPALLRSLDQHVGELELRLKAVESRLGALEHPLAPHESQPPAEPEPATATVAADAGSPVQAGSLFPVLGKALLGIAGAYALRAVEEAGALPRLSVAAAGIVYAFIWLIGAARTRSGPRIASSVYASTSALILAPMLWELTLRFNVLPAAASAAVVCAFALAAFVPAVSTPDSRNAVARVACIAAAVLAVVLAIASHILLPFVAALLLLSAVCEFTPGGDLVPEAGALIALAADGIIWILVYVYFAGQSAYEGFPALSRGALLAPGVAIFVLFAVSAGVKTMLRARQITFFQTLQTIISFLLFAVSLADFGPRSRTTILGVTCLVLSAASYAAVFTVFAQQPQRRNTAVFAAWGAMLLFAGGVFYLSSLPSILLLGAAALAAAALGRQAQWNFFALYSMAFLLAASVVSGLLKFIASALAGSPGPPSAGVWFSAACAMLCYAAALPADGKRWTRHTLLLSFAALAAGALAAFFVEGLFALIALSVIPGAHHLALIRTVVLCAAALAMVSAGARWRRRELTHLGYTTLALVAMKLVTEDLRHGHLGYIAASIFLFAFTLIAAPRVARARQRL